MASAAEIQDDGL